MTYQEKLEELFALKCLAHSNKRSNQYCQCFAIRGTGIFLTIAKAVYSRNLNVDHSYDFRWSVKNKAYNRRSTGSKYLDITFEDVLMSKAISETAREELLFNLDVFVEKK